MWITTILVRIMVMLNTICGLTMTITGIPGSPMCSMKKISMPLLTIWERRERAGNEKGGRCCVRLALQDGLEPTTP